MSRVIKFRVWQKEKSRFCQGYLNHNGDLFFIHYDPDPKQDGRFGHYIGACVPQDRDSYVVEQFTGLLDSKGVEIYEGDIVSRIATYVGPDVKPVYPFEGEVCKRLATIYYVEYVPSKGRFELAKHYVGGNRAWADFNEIKLGSYEVTHEVLGNIHENSNLL